MKSITNHLQFNRTCVSFTVREFQCGGWKF